MLKLTILIHCADNEGIISAVTNFLHQKSGNIIYLDQHVDQQTGVFFMRLEAEFSHDLGIIDFKNEFHGGLAKDFNMKWSCHEVGTKPRMAVFVSKYNHCLYDLLSRYQSGELQVEIPFIVSNHDNLRHVANQFDIPYYHISVNKTNKARAENEQLKLLEAANVDFIVLARYMQIVSETLISRYPNKIINIHHSFLPAFVGAKPYHAAYERGVKIIGATSHYVTKALDAGPIIAQDVTAVSHTHNVQDFISKGRDLEKIVLSRAVKLHVHQKTMVYNNKTVIFT